MTKDKLIKVRATAYDKAVLAALIKKMDEQTILSGKTTESDIVRYAIDQLARKHLSSTDLENLSQQHLE